MKKKIYVLLSALTLLTSVGTTACAQPASDSSTVTQPSADSSVSSQPSVDSSVSEPSADSSTSETHESTETPTQKYSCTIIPDSYGTITTDKEEYAVGETVTVQITSKTADVAPAALNVNGTEQAVEGSEAKVTMTAGGLILKAEYRHVLTDFTAVSDLTSITVTPIEGAEYSIDDGEFQSNNSFTGLLPDTSHKISVRIAASGNLRASNTVTKTLSTQNKRYLIADLLMQISSLDENPLALKGDFSIQRYLGGAFYDETLFDNELYFSDDLYYLNSAFQDDGTNKIFKQVAKGEDGLCENVYLNYDNTLVEETLPSAERFDEAYANTFDDLTLRDIELTDDGRFYVDGTKIAADKGKSIFSLLTTYSDNLVSLYFSVDDSGKLASIEAYSTYSTEVTVDMQPSTLTYVERITLDVTDPSNLGVTQVQSKQFDKTALQTTFSLLAEGNYTADVVEEDFRQNITEYKYYATGNDIQITSPTGYVSGYHDTEDGLAAYDLVSKEDAVSLKGRRDYPEEGSTVAGTLPTFDIDANLFNYKGGNTYTLEGRFGLYQFLPRILPDRFLDICRSSEALQGDATISILSDSVVISYVYEDRYGYQGTITSTLTDIGSTEAPYDFDSLYSPYTTPTSWEELNSEFYDLLVEYIKDPSLLPFYWLPADMDNSSNLLSYSYQEALEKDMLELLTFFPDWDKAYSYLENYRQTLLDAGFEEYQSYHFRKGDIDLFFTSPEIIGQTERKVILWVYRV